MLKKILLLILSLQTLSCAGLKIETGQSKEEATESNAEQASRLRSEWANLLSHTPDEKRPEQFREIVRRTMANYRYFGNQILTQWEEGEQGRGKAINADEMRKMIEQWIAPQQPVLKAYDDMFEYTYDQLKKQFPNDQQLLDAAKIVSEFYYNAYSVFFYPTGNVDDYRFSIESNSIETDRILTEFSQSMPN